MANELNLTVASVGAETGALLRQYLEARGLTMRWDAGVGVCYGQDCAQEVGLNKACSTNKMERMELMKAAGVRMPHWFKATDLDNEFSRLERFLPVFARKSMSHGAKDLMPCFTLDEVRWRAAAGWDWFSKILPIDAEWRVWVFRGEMLGVYKKVMRRPAEYVGMGRNFSQGFEFAPQSWEDDAPLVEEAIAAVKAIGLDFAAVDLITTIGDDAWEVVPYVLEANTAPGVIRSGAQPTLAKLADKIVEWVREQA